MSENMLSTDVEVDFTEAGFQPQDVDLAITDVSRKDIDGTGEKIIVNVTFEASVVFDEAVGPKPVEVRCGLWEAHPNNTAQAIGQRGLKRLGLAAVGSASYNYSSLAGQLVHGRVQEDRNGYLEVDSRRFSAIAA